MITSANESALRRLERDLHDGPQARLVAIGLLLSRIESDGHGSPERDATVSQAKQAVADALDELRGIIGGIHPPALDSGLEVALTTLTSRSDVPAALHYRVVQAPGDAVASTVYFAASELLANVSRHANATAVTVTIDETDDALRLTVSDDGKGGAQVLSNGGPMHGRGLGGLRERAAALDGRVEVRSPAGGPTVVTVTIPRS